MNEIARFSRRRALALITGFGVSGFSLNLSADDKQTVLLLDKGFFADLRMNTRHVDRLVRPLIESGTMPASRATLEAEVLGRTKLRPDQLKSHLKDKIADDFTEGRSLRVDGWVLSQTEVRLLVLYWLVHTQSN